MFGAFDHRIKADVEGDLYRLAARMAEVRAMRKLTGEAKSCLRQYLHKGRAIGRREHRNIDVDRGARCARLNADCNAANERMADAGCSERSRGIEERGDLVGRP